MLCDTQHKAEAIDRTSVISSVGPGSPHRHRQRRGDLPSHRPTFQGQGRLPEPLDPDPDPGRGLRLRLPEARQQEVPRHPADHSAGGGNDPGRKNLQEARSWELLVVGFCSFVPFKI